MGDTSGRERLRSVEEEGNTATA